MIFEQRAEKMRESWRKSILNRGISKWKGPGAGSRLDLEMNVRGEENDEDGNWGSSVQATDFFKDHGNDWILLWEKEEAI